MSLFFANEWAVNGVNVNVMALGYIVQTILKPWEMTQFARHQFYLEFWQVLGEDQKVLLGQIVILCSDTSNYINESITLVDGGWMGR